MIIRRCGAWLAALVTVVGGSPDHTPAPRSRRKCRPERCNRRRWKIGRLHTTRL